MSPSSSGRRRRQQRGQGNAERRRVARSLGYLRRVNARRLSDTEYRVPDTIDRPGAPTITVVPYLGTLQPQSPWLSQQVNPFTEFFYRLHPGTNSLLEVRSGVNVANPLGTNSQRGVFTTCDVEDGTILCPYLGRLGNQDSGSGYSMRLSRNQYIDAELTMYDTGYFMYLRRGGHAHRPCPPNYGRYVNSIRRRDSRQRHLQYNAVFEASEDGYEEVWIRASRDIPSGSEVLVDYGSMYHL